MAFLITIIIILQLSGGFIKFGPFSVSLVLVPIVVGAAMYGSTAGAVFGGAFGVIVLINCISGVDAGGYMLWAVNPFLTAVLCLAKGMLAGLAAGIVYSAISKRNVYIGIVCAAFICPVVNTGIFLAAMVFLYHDTLMMWAGDTPIVYYTFIGLAGVNFLLEMGVNMLLSPLAARIINVVKKT